MIDHFNVNFSSIIFVIHTDLLYIFCFVLYRYCVKNLMDVYDLCHTYEFMSKISSLL